MKRTRPTLPDSLELLEGQKRMRASLRGPASILAAAAMVVGVVVSVVISAAPAMADPTPAIPEGVLGSQALAGVACNGPVFSALSCEASGQSTPAPALQGVVVGINASTPGTAQTVSGTLTLRAVACHPPTGCTVVGDVAGPLGDIGVVVPVTGGPGGVPGTPATVAGVESLTAVSCSSPTFCVAVGGSTSGTGVVVPIAVGTPGVVTSVPGTGPLFGVSCPSFTFCEAVGQDPTATRAVVVSINSGVPAAPRTVVGAGVLYAVACPSVITCEAVGQDNSSRGVAVSVVGGTPSGARVVPGANALYGLSCPTTALCLGVGQDVSTSGGVVASVPFASTPGSAVAVAGSSTLSAIACPDANTCEAVGTSSSRPQGVVVDIGTGFTVAAPVFSADSPPPTATVGTAYSYTFAATGSPAPTFFVSSGSLPAGLTLDPITGMLSGTPSAPGASTFTVTASNGVPPDAVSPSLTITVSTAGTGTAPVLTADSPPATATVGTPYSYTFAATGSPAPVFGVSSGALPAGLTLALTTGVLSGAPTTPGTSTFKVTAGNGVAPEAISPTLTITVSATGPPPPGPGGAYTAVSPTRITDTRAGSGQANAGATLAPGGALAVSVGPSVPATATAVALSVTAVDATAAGFLAVYPGSAPSGATESVLDFVAGGPGCSTPDCVVPNLVITKLTGGHITVSNTNSHGGTVDVIVDLQGYFDPTAATTSGAGHYRALSPARLADTRCATTPPQPGVSAAGCAAEHLLAANAARTTVAAGGTLNVATGLAGASAAVVQLTATNTTADGYLTAYSGAAPAAPTASNVNFVTGQTTSNRAIVPLGADGTINIFNHAGTTDVVVDLVGSFSDATGAPTAGALFTPVAPTRLIDTRTGRPLGPDSSLNDVAITGEAGIPAEAGGQPTAAVLNITEATATADSFLTVTPNPITPPATTSDVNFNAGDIRANADLATLSASGTVNVYNYTGTTNVVIDAFGYFSSAAP